MNFHVVSVRIVHTSEKFTFYKGKTGHSKLHPRHTFQRLITHRKKGLRDYVVWQIQRKLNDLLLYIGENRPHIGKVPRFG